MEQLLYMSKLNGVLLIQYMTSVPQFGSCFVPVNLNMTNLLISSALCDPKSRINSFMKEQ